MPKYPGPTPRKFNPQLPRIAGTIVHGKRNKLWTREPSISGKSAGKGKGDGKDGGARIYESRGSLRHCSNRCDDFSAAEKDQGSWKPRRDVERRTLKNSAREAREDFVGFARFLVRQAGQACARRVRSLEFFIKGDPSSPWA